MEVPGATGKLIHIEMYDSRMFGGDECDGGVMYVYQGDWHGDPGALRRANCLRCLEAAQRVGSYANKAMNAARRAGETFDSQAATMQSDREERDRKRRESGSQMATLSSFSEIIQEHYPDGRVPQARRLTPDEIRNLKKAP